MKKQLMLLTLLTIFGGHLLAQGWNYSTSTGTTFILYGMSFPPSQSNIGYACGMQYTYNADGVVIKTTDGGENWTSVLPTSGDIDGLQGIWFIDDNTGFAGGWNNYFIKTTDGGTNWTPVTCGSNVWYYVDVEFWDSNNGVAAASMNGANDQSVFITSDGGNTWVSATSGTDVNIMGITYADQNTLFAVGTSGNVIQSTDGGHNWTVKAALPAMLFGLDFANSTFGVVGGEEKMFATNDGGSTWTTYTTGYENFYAAKAYADGTGYIGGTDENIYVTTDFGATWAMEHNGSGTSSLYRIRATPDGDLFACGSQGTIITKIAPFGADFTASEDTICEGSTVDFTDLSSGTITSWNWTFEGGTPPTSTDQNPTVTYNSTGEYDVTLEISDGTTSDTKYEADMIHVIVEPIAPNTPAGATAICAGSIEEYTTLSIDGADSYYWEVDPTDAGTITGTGITGTFNSDDSWTGDYTIKVKATNMCGWGPWSNVLNCTLNFNPYMFSLSEGGGYCSGGNGIEIILDGSETGVDYELFLDGTSTGTILAGTGNSLSFGLQTGQGIYTVT
ncbi:MAG: PKD domain-containing protein, partial [Bacteroidota bacterium]